jgi:predicted membrane protein
MIKLCPPATIYLLFSATQILIDLFKGLYNTAFIKSIVMIMVTLLLNILCEQGLNVVSWIIVFIPFILMTVIVTIILYFFGLDASTGTMNYNCINKKQYEEKQETKETKSMKKNPIHSEEISSQMIPYNSSSPAYQS